MAQFGEGNPSFFSLIFFAPRGPALLDLIRFGAGLGIAVAMHIASVKARLSPQSEAASH
jgi:hypothetical protein